jgi:hypothetical protein
VYFGPALDLRPIVRKPVHDMIPVPMTAVDLRLVLAQFLDNQRLLQEEVWVRGIVELDLVGLSKCQT